MNTTLVQSQLPCSVAPLLASRIKNILSREDLRNLLALEQKFDAIYAEKSEFSKAINLLDEARADFSRSAENRARFDDLVAKYKSDQHCRDMRDACDNQLRDLSALTPAAVHVVLLRVRVSLDEAYAEHCAHECQSYALVGIDFDPEVNGGEIVNFIKLKAHELSLTLAQTKRGKCSCAENPAGVLEQYFDLASIKKESLAPTLPVPREEITSRPAR